MILVDTSVWIEYFRQSNPATIKLLESYLEEGEVIALSAVFGELLQGVKNAKEEKIILEFWIDLPKVNEVELFIEAGKLSRHYKWFTRGVGLIDSYILAAVGKYNLTLWSLDKKLLEAYSSL